MNSQNTAIKDKVLVVDDEPSVRYSLEAILHTRYEVFMADSIATGLETLKAENPGVVILDISLGGENGLDLLKKIRASELNPKVILVTASPKDELIKPALNLNANDFIEKPFEAIDVRNSVRDQLMYWKSENEEKQKNSDPELQNKLQKVEQQIDQLKQVANLGELSMEFVHDLANHFQSLSLNLMNLKFSCKENHEENFLVDNLNRMDMEVHECHDLLRFWQSLGNGKDQKPEIVAINEILRELWPTFQLMDGADKLFLKLESAYDDISILVNKVELKRVIRNLVVNALQALDSEEGKVLVTLKPIQDKVEIQIEDSGCGIPKDRIEHIFEAGHSSKRERGGSGLGLYIVRQIIEKYHGTIQVNSSPQTGTVMTIQFPQQKDFLKSTPSAQMHKVG